MSIKSYSGLNASMVALGQFPNNVNQMPVPTWTDTTGTSHSTLYGLTSSSNLPNTAKNIKPFVVKKAYAFSGSYSSSDYQATDEATTVIQSQSMSSATGQYSIVVKVTATSSLTLTAIKFTGDLVYYDGSAQTVETLMFGYFFDTPITMANGDEKVITLVLG